MRRGPHEDQREHQRAFNRNATRRHRPADHRRKGPGRPADHDVLRGQAFEPHRIDNGVKEDGESQQPRRQQVRRQPKHHHSNARQGQTQAQRLAPRNDTRRHRALGGAAHHRVDIGIPPHVQCARGPCPQRDEQDRGQRHNRMHRNRRNQQADQRREDDKRHHPRLEQRHIIPETGLAGLGDGLIKGLNVAHRSLPATGPALWPAPAVSLQQPLSVRQPAPPARTAAGFRPSPTPATAHRRPRTRLSR